MAHTAHTGARRSSIGHIVLQWQTSNAPTVDSIDNDHDHVCSDLPPEQSRARCNVITGTRKRSICLQINAIIKIKINFVDGLLCLPICLVGSGAMFLTIHRHLAIVAVVVVVASSIFLLKVGFEKAATPNEQNERRDRLTVYTST